MNFCVTDGASVVATRYVSSRNDAAASLVRILFLFLEWSNEFYFISDHVVVLFRDDFQ